MNIIGYFNYHFGIAKNAHYLHNLLSRYNIDHQIYNINTPAHTKNNNNIPTLNNINVLKNQINIFILVDIPTLQQIIQHCQKIKTYSTKFILYYVQEVAGQEEDYHHIFPFFDKIIVPSLFVKTILDKYYSVVDYLPLVPIKSNFIEQIPYRNKTVCLYICDVHSCIYRKNINGYISLIERCDNPNYFFILKINNLHYNKNLEQKLDNIENKNFKLIPHALTNNDYNDLMNICDIYISLHRSEGYGLTIYEATQKNKYILTTNYSAPSEYLQNYSKFIKVNHTITNTNKFIDSPYSKYKAEWCEPDIDDCYHKLLYIEKNIPDIYKDFTREKLVNIIY